MHSAENCLFNAHHFKFAVKIVFFILAIITLFQQSFFYLSDYYHMVLIFGRVIFNHMSCCAFYDHCTNVASNRL